MQKKYIVLAAIVCLLVACGKQGAENTDGSAYAQNEEANLLNEMELVNNPDALIQKYGKLAYRDTFTLFQKGIR